MACVRFNSGKPATEAHLASAPRKTTRANNSVNTPPQADQTATAEGPSVQDQVATVLKPLFDEYGQAAVTAWRAEYKAKFKLQADVPTAANITTPEQFAFTEAYLNNYKKAQPRK